MKSWTFETQVRFLCVVYNRLCKKADCCNYVASLSTTRPNVCSIASPFSLSPSLFVCSHVCAFQEQTVIENNQNTSCTSQSIVDYDWHRKKEGKGKVDNSAVYNKRTHKVIRSIMKAVKFVRRG